MLAAIRRAHGTRPVCGSTSRPAGVFRLRDVTVELVARRSPRSGRRGSAAAQRAVRPVRPRGRLSDRIGQHDDQPGPARRRRQVAVENRLELERGGGKAGALLDLQRELAGRDVSPRRCRPRRADRVPTAPPPPRPRPARRWPTSRSARMATASRRDRRSRAASTDADRQRREVADRVAPALVLLLGPRHHVGDRRARRSVARR